MGKFGYIEVEMDNSKFLGKVTNAVVILMSIGFIASPVFVYDKVDALEQKCKEIFATKEGVGYMSKDLDEIKKQQKADHDILIEIKTELKKGR